jgi:hypothetical protein
MFGRLCGGIATSLLFSVFEAWMVYEHNRRGFPAEVLAQTFSLATFGNGLVAVGSGLLADWVANRWGFVAPFMAALALLIVAGVIITASWTENYGDQGADLVGTFANALAVLRDNRRVLLLGCVQSLFEAAMYTFVFMWTPALQGEGEQAEGRPPLPFGLIFACYMVAIMIGSALFSILVRSQPVETIGRLLLLAACAALAVPFITVRLSLFSFSLSLFFVLLPRLMRCAGREVAGPGVRGVPRVRGVLRAVVPDDRHFAQPHHPGGPACRRHELLPHAAQLPRLRRPPQGKIRKCLQSFTEERDGEHRCRCSRRARCSSSAPSGSAWHWRCTTPPARCLPRSLFPPSKLRLLPLTIDSDSGRQGASRPRQTAPRDPITPEIPDCRSAEPAPAVTVPLAAAAAEILARV